MTRSPRQPFLWLLVAILGLLVLLPADDGTAGERLLAVGLLTTAYLAGFAVIYKERRHRAAGLLLGIPALAAIWAEYLFAGLPRVHVALTAHALALLFLLLTTAVILGRVFRLSEVSIDAVAGALCGYLIVGVAFGHAYCLVEELAPGSFRGREPGPTWPGQMHARLTYFSFVTLTTVGYGDITPARGLARGLAMVEAVVGQFYIAVVIADLIGKRVAQALADRRGA